MVVGNTISGNKVAAGEGTAGGGIYMSNSSPTIEGNEITGDVADFGGGIVIQGNSSPTIVGNTIRNNEAKTGGVSS